VAEDVFIWQIVFNSLLNFHYVVLLIIELVGHCCNPQLSVIIIIIIMIKTLELRLGEYG